MANYKHGHSTSPTYASWQSMKSRCGNPLATNYPRYGGRGITYDHKWEVFAFFIADMGLRPVGKTLDRKDNDANYSKTNCRWATPAEQTRNSTTAKIRPHQLVVIKWLSQAGMTQKDIASLYAPVNRPAISKILLGERWNDALPVLAI